MKQFLLDFFWGHGRWFLVGPGILFLVAAAIYFWPRVHQ